jgi:hypothetical protein
MKRIASHHRANSGFTLTELMIAAVLGMGLAVVAGDFMLSHIKSQARRESIQRQKDDWKRASRFMESEVAMSSRIFTNAEAIALPANCNLEQDEIKLALELPLELPVVVYGIRKLDGNTTNVDRSQWLGEGDNSQHYGLLIRCGPAITITNPEDGGLADYDKGSPPIQNVLLDGIDTRSSASGGLYVKQTDAKSASFSLALRPLAKEIGSLPPIYFNAGNYSRINPIAAFPQEDSLCSRACKADSDPPCKDFGASYMIPVKTEGEIFNVPYEGITENDSITVCSVVNSATINGGERSDVIDGLKPSPLPAAEQPGVVINGGDGRNFLLGTNGPDTINGGNGDDVIVGRGGADTLNGSDGNNSYSPWPSLSDPSLNNLLNPLTTTVSGGSGLDVIYLRGNREDFSGVNNCRRESICTITPSNTDIKISLQVNSGFEVIVFKNARIDLP